MRYGFDHLNYEISFNISQQQLQYAGQKISVALSISVISKKKTELFFKHEIMEKENHIVSFNWNM